MPSTSTASTSLAPRLAADNGARAGSCAYISPAARQAHTHPKSRPSSSVSANWRRGERVGVGHVRPPEVEHAGGGGRGRAAAGRIYACRNESDEPRADPHNGMLRARSARRCSSSWARCCRARTASASRSTPRRVSSSPAARTCRAERHLLHRLHGSGGGTPPPLRLSSVIDCFFGSRFRRTRGSREALAAGGLIRRGSAPPTPNPGDGVRVPPPRRTASRGARADGRPSGGAARS